MNLTIKKHLKVTMSITSLLASATSLCYLLNFFDFSDNFYSMIPTTFAIPLSIVGLTSSFYNVYILKHLEQSLNEIEGQTTNVNPINYYALPPSISAQNISPHLQPISTNHIVAPSRNFYHQNEGVPRLNI